MPDIPTGPIALPDPVGNPTLEARNAARLTYKPHAFKSITDPDVGKVDYLIDGLIPRGDAVLWAATWKTAKTLCAYRLALDALQGKPIWGRFPVEHPLRVAIFQLEMPSVEDDRRFHRLARGLDLDPAVVQRFAKMGQLMHFSRPRIDLTNQKDVDAFHACISVIKPDLVILDSVVAAFCAGDLNDNAKVRHFLSKAILPVTEEGIAVLLLHHFRKLLELGRNPDKKSSILGAGQFGAATSRIYSLERLANEEPTKKAFNVQLSMLGGWTPDDNVDTILRVEDTADDTGTTVEALDLSKESKKIRPTAIIRAAIDLKKLLYMSGRTARKDAITVLCAEKGYGRRTVEDAIDYAALQPWIEVVASADKKNNAKDLVPFVYGDEDDLA